MVSLDGPNLETGALSSSNFEIEVLKMIEIECQIEANPTPSYVWYEMIDNITTGQSVFGTTRKIQRIYQNPGKYAMECQAQSRGKTVKQQFFINVVGMLFYFLFKYFFIFKKISFSSYSTIKCNENAVRYKWKL